MVYNLRNTIKIKHVVQQITFKNINSVYLFETARLKSGALLHTDHKTNGVM